MGKGDKPRKQTEEQRKKYRNNHTEIFGEVCRFPHKHTEECKLDKGDTDER